MTETTYEQIFCEQMTGCRGAGDFGPWAEAQGFPHLEVVDWTSSAGNWRFIVSRDGETWYRMFQENNYLRGPGFSRTIDEEQSWHGTAEEVLQMIFDTE